MVYKIISSLKPLIKKPQEHHLALMLIKNHTFHNKSNYKLKIIKLQAHNTFIDNYTFLSLKEYKNIIEKNIINKKIKNKYHSIKMNLARGFINKFV